MRHAFRCCVAWLLLTAMGAGLAVAQSRTEAKYVGRPLTDVLREMQASGVKLVYSLELVRPDLRVVAEPRARAPRKRIDELLKPHGLETRDGPNGTILVVTRARTPKAAKPSAAAPEVGSIGGRVLDATTAAPLAGVVVEVQTTGHSVRTDDNGHFVLAGIPAGRHPLFVSTIGYGLARPVVDVRAGASTELDVPLAEGTGAYTERVTVTADPLAVPTAGAPAQETLGSAALLGVRAVLIDDPLRAVQSLPGVAANDDMRSDFSVRGSDFRHVGTSIDGVATPWLLHEFQENSDSGSLSVLNSDILDRVTLSLGAYPQRYSDRTGAWLESTMREGSRAATAFRAAVSGTNASVLAEGPIGAEAGYEAVIARVEAELQKTGATWIATTDYRTYAMLRWYLKDRLPVIEVIERGRFQGFADPGMDRIKGHTGLYVAREPEQLLPVWNFTGATREPLERVERVWRGVVMDTYALEKLTGWTPELLPQQDSPLYRARPLAGKPEGLRGNRGFVIAASVR